MNEKDFEKEFQHIFNEYLIREIEMENHSATISHSVISKINIDVDEYFLNNPIDAFFTASRIANEELKEFDIRWFRIKNLITHKTTIANIRQRHIGKLWEIEGVVRRVTGVFPLVRISYWQCEKCGNIIRNIEFNNPFDVVKTKITPPVYCEKDLGGCGRKSYFTSLEEKNERIDCQKIEIQDIFEDVSQPQNIELLLFDDLCGKVTAGETIKSVAIIHAVPLWKRGGTFSSSLRFIGTAIYLESIEKTFEEIKLSPDDVSKIEQEAKSPDIIEKLKKSFIPSIYGYDLIKEALLLQLVGGVQKKVNKNTIRGDIHILLCGDPSTAKSQILTYVKNFSPKGLYVSGKGVSEAGLTASVTKAGDMFGEGRWVLEAGAMVLANNGILCVDEIEKMKPQDREAMHTAMEQQIIAISKAGINTTLKAKCSVLGACNPKLGRFDNAMLVADQLPLPSTLLTRFDLIFILKDKPNRERDEELASHILSIHQNYEHINTFYSDDFIKKYIAYAKQFKPQLTKDAVEYIKNFFLSLREKSKDSIAITSRYLEGLVRLAEASAKLRLSNVVIEEDSKRACRLMKECLKDIIPLEEIDEIDIDTFETKIPKTKRDKMILLKDMIRSLYEESKTPIAIETLREKAVELGITLEELNNLIEILREKGLIYEPRYGYIVPTSL